MKNSIVLLISIMFGQWCIAQSNTTENLIKKVENGLTSNLVYIEGDATSSIEERMKHYGIPGVSIAVIHDSKVVWTKGYGIVDKESKVPVTKQTLFQASALSIPVTAYGALRTVEQHKLDLDVNVNKYLKSWKVPENEFTKEKKVTIKNLLNHSAGIYPRGTGSYSINEKIPTLVEILNGVSPAKNEPITVNKEPGKSVRFAYASYVPVQQMMIDIKEKTFPVIMDELVLQPLEMNHSTFNQTLNAKQLTKAATGYLQDGTMVEGRKKIYPSMASYGLWTTAQDYAKFIANIQQTLKGENAKGLSKELTELMGTPYGVHNSSWSFTCRLGFQLFNKTNDIYLRHHGWNTGFYAEVMAHRDKGYGVVVMTNSTFPEFNAEVIRAVALAYNWDNYLPVHKKISIKPALANSIIGRYQNTNRVVTVFQKDNQLFAKNILYTDAQELVRVSDSLYVTRNSSRLIQFKPNVKDGTIDLLYINRNDNTASTTLTKTNISKKEPVELLVEGDFEKTLQAYKALIKQDPTHPTVDEEYIDDLGELFFNQHRIEIALNAFKLNTKLYPDRFEVYDRYAKYCERTGKIDLAILNYNKALELNPQYSSAKEKIKELQKSK